MKYVLEHWGGQGHIVLALDGDTRSPWFKIEDAPKDRVIYVFTEGTGGLEDLPSFTSRCKYHPDAGFCTDELRQVTHWQELS